MTGPARPTGRRDRVGRAGRSGRAGRREQADRSDRPDRPDRGGRGRPAGGAGARPTGAAAGSPGRTRRVARAGRPVPGRRRRGLWVGLAAGVLAVAVLVWLTAFSPLLDVRRVQVVGAAPDQVGPIRGAAAVGPGTSLLWLDGDDVVERVRTLPRIASVDVSRDWPGTLVVTVSEREPVLATPVPGGVLLTDVTGFGYRTLPERPTGVPTLVLPPGVLPSPDDPNTRAAADVVVALPAALRDDLVEVRANGRFDVSFVLTNGRAVRWGADADNERKAAVLSALLTRPGSVYDVSTPDLAVVR